MDVQTSSSAFPELETILSPTFERMPTLMFIFKLAIWQPTLAFSLLFLQVT